MKCPVCSAVLSRTKYEGLPILICNECNGHLVGKKRVTDIQRRQSKTIESLQLESLTGSRLDSEDTLRCPRCRRMMSKELKKNAEGFHLDNCSGCQLVWFDAGELAQLQLDYAATHRGQDAVRFQNRLREMTPEERRQYEENIANLPAGDMPMTDAIGAAFLESLSDLADGIW